ncbi:hypothetical protein [Streptomyces sp. NPDC059783]|uniref:hypothetical protein n=1 Tax=Streptomyces sp. NPDC059783 TaxID=3346944 RepID=UPI00364ABE83
MELKGWFRRRPAAGVPDAGRASEPGAGDAPAPGPASSLPGADWDGGWRRVAPPEVTIARSSIGVSDGLRFRSGLASWQNVAYSDGDLGHAVLPSAPVGRVHGVTRAPGTPRVAPPGAPLVLRAVAPPAPDGEPPAAPVSGGTGTAPGPASTGRPRTSTAQGPASTGRPGTEPRTGPRRVVRAVPGSATGAPVPAPRPQENPAPVRARRPSPPLVVARRPTAATPRDVSAVPSSGVPASVPVAETPPVRAGLGEPLGALPPGAVPSAPEPPVVQRRVDASAEPAVRPGSGGPPFGAGAELPVVQRQVDASASAGPAVRRGPGDEADAGVLSAPEAPPGTQRRTTAPPVRPALGEPLGERPSVGRPSSPSAAAGPAPSGPELPVVQRQVDSSTGTVAGPPTVRPAPAGRPSAATPGGAELPVVQRHADAPASPGPAAGSSVRPTLGGQQPATVPAGEAGALAGPALPVVQREADASATAVPPGRRTPGVPAGPAAPVVHRPADAPAGSSVRATPGGQPSMATPEGPELPVVQRRTDTSVPAVPPAGAALPVVVRHADTPAPAVPPVRPTPGTGPAPATASAEHGPRTPAVRPALGKPLRELPAGAAPFVPRTRDGAADPVAPALPVVQRQMSDTAATRPAPEPGATIRPVPGPAHPAPGTPPTGPGSRARTRGGLGAPLSALPPTAGAAGVAGTAPRGTQGGPAIPRAGEPGPPAMPLRAAPPAPTVERAAVRVRPVPGRGAFRSVPVQRARALLVARTLAVRTGAAEGFTASASAGTDRPVVPAVWRRDTPRPQEPGEARPVVQRVAAAPVAPPRPHAPLPARSAAPWEPAVPGGLAPEPAPRAPVVRPHPPGTSRPGGSAAPVQRLAMPVVAEPEPEGGAPSGVRPTAPRPAHPAPAQANAQAVQRAVAHAGPSGVPVTVVQRQPAPRPAPERPAEPAPDVDVEDLARRLIDPVARLLRADLRRGRERSGRPYDGRR